MYNIPTVLPLYHYNQIQMKMFLIVFSNYLQVFPVDKTGRNGSPLLTVFLQHSQTKKEFSARINGFTYAIFDVFDSRILLSS